MPDPRIIGTPRLPEGVLGCTDGHSTIWLDDQLLDVDRSFVLEHELIHYHRGHTGHCLTVVEYGIDRELACRRVDAAELGEAAARPPHPWVIADELDVMPETIEERLHVLTPGERAALEARVEDAWWQ